MMEAGQYISRYRILRTLGQGGMGVVYEAIHELIGRRAAIKVLHPELAQSPELVARFLTEARAVNQVRHPGLVEIFEFGTLPDATVYLIMEFLAGEPLSRRLARPGWRLGIVDLDLLRQVALTLQAVHEHGIVHRDLKPENVMVVPDPERPDPRPGPAPALRHSGPGEKAKPGRELRRKTRAKAAPGRRSPAGRPRPVYTPF
jgi:serine/threonine protein kinase